MSCRRFGKIMLPATLALWLTACGINAIPTAEENAKAKWADVQNQYQRRADLIPNLVATVRGYAEQEREVLVERSEEHTSELQSLMSISYAVFCLKKKKT